MKKITLLIFIGMISAMSYGQEQKYFSVEPADHENFFYNEFWRFANGMIAAVHFEEYFFAKDGSYTYSKGYSGGAYWKHEGSGVYTYNPTEKIIRLKTLEGLAAPEQVDIEAIFKTETLADEDTTTLHFKISKEIFFNQQHRNVGVTTDGYWFKGESSWNDCFRFHLFGQVEISQELNQIYKYVCGYHLIGDLLFLEIKSMKIGDKDTELFTPSVKTFIKICVKDKTVLIEKIDINTILDGTRNWTFKDMGFYIDNISIVEEPNEWDEYNRRIASNAD